MIELIKVNTLVVVLVIYKYQEFFNSMNISLLQ